MIVLTIDKITATVGASVAGVDRYQLLEDEAFPTQVHEALEANGALVFRELQLDDEAQIAFSRRLGEIELVGRGEKREIFRVVLDPAKNPAAEYLKG